MLLKEFRSEQDPCCIMFGCYSSIKAPGSLKASTYSSSLEPLESTEQEETLDKALSKLKSMTTYYIIFLAIIGQISSQFIKGFSLLKIHNRKD